MTQLELSPLDEFNRELLAQVRPSDWVNPTATGRYNLVVIGAGTAGLVAAAGAAGLGAKVALVERDLMGGDCLNVGCVPSKSLLHAARICAAVRRGTEFGLHADWTEFDFGAVMRRLREQRARLSPHDSAERFRGLGVDVFQGAARFSGRDSVQVAGQELRFRRALVATGARAVRPSLSGLEDVGYLTNETVFNLTALPRRLAVLGGGPIGCELAQAFARLGSQVTLFHQGPRLLEKDDPQAAEIVLQAFRGEGLEVRLRTVVQHVFRRGSDKVLQAVCDGTPVETAVDEILVGVGRAPNVNEMGLEEAGVQFDVRRGIDVNDFLQTSNRRIYAAGDVCSAQKFTHAADFQARLVVQNALFCGRARASSLRIPHCTYTSPEVAQVGLTEDMAREQGIACDSYVQPLARVDRAVLEGDDQGFVKILTRRNTDQIIGGTIVAAQAGDLISEVSVAMAGPMGLKRLASIIHPYPTQADAIRKLGDAYNRTRLTPLIKGLFDRWLRWTR